MSTELLHLGQIATSVFALVGAMLLGYMLKTGADKSIDYFSGKFLRYASWAMLFIAIEVVFAEYKALRLTTEAMPIDAAVAGFLGRVIEAVGLWSVVGYLVRGNGKSTSGQ